MHPDSKLGFNIIAEERIHGTKFSSACRKLHKHTVGFKIIAVINHFDT